MARGREVKHRKKLANKGGKSERKRGKKEGRMEENGYT
jgi:hypothetical protein